MESYQALLRRLGQSTGIGDCGADEGGFCALQFAEGPVVHLQLDAAGTMITMSAEAGAIDDDYCSAIYPALLEANTANRTENGVIYGIDPVSRSIELYRRLPATSEFPEFEAALDDFVGELERWCDIVARQGEIFGAVVDGSAKSPDADDEGPAIASSKVLWG